MVNCLQLDVILLGRIRNIIRYTDRFKRDYVGLYLVGFSMEREKLAPIIVIVVGAIVFFYLWS